MPIKSKNEGSALIVSLLILIMIIVVALTATLVSIQNQTASEGEQKSNQSIQMADSGIEDLMYQLTKAGHDNVSQIDGCQSDGLIKTSKYTVRLQDANGNGISCQDNTVPTVDVVSVKAVNYLSGQARAIEADIICRNPYDTDLDTVALYHFQDDNSASSLVDSSGYNNVASISGNLDVISGICKARYFDGNTSDYAYMEDPDVSPSHPLRLDGSMTVEAWVKLDSTTILNWERIAGKGGDIDGDYDLGVSSSGWEFRVNNGACDVSSNHNFDTDWHFIAGVYDGSRIDLYVDGAKQPGGNACSTTPVTNDSDFTIGYSPNISGSDPFAGIIDEVRVSKTDRSDTYISDEYDKGTIFNLP